MKKQSGFTIIELLIATTVFSLVLMVVLAGILQITKMYYRGATEARTQETLRSIVDEVAESLRFSSGNLVFPPVSAVGPDIAAGSTDTNYFCLNNRRYTYAIDRQLKNNPTPNTKQKRHVLWVDQPDSGCTGVADLTQDDPCGVDCPLSPGRELLSENMRITQLDIDQIIPGEEVYKIDISIAYGDDDLLELEPPSSLFKSCKTSGAGIEFCAESNLSVTVEKRL